jgi:uncharacterized membrane protein (Fun14 family)
MQSSHDQLPYLEMGVGFLLGLAIGYTIKKSFKILLFLVGLGIISLFIFESQGLLSLNEATISHHIDSLFGQFQSLFSLIKERLERFSTSQGVSSLAGFVVGLKIG